MVLNASKTKSLLVTGKRLQKKTPDTNLKLTCNGSEIEQITLHKLLGLKLDNHLTFTEHIADICKKVSQRIAVLKKIKRSLPLAERKLYFNALHDQADNVVWFICMVCCVRRERQPCIQAAKKSSSGNLGCGYR